MTKRYIDYATTYTSLGREKSLVDSRLVSSKRRAADERLERSDLRRRTVTEAAERSNAAARSATARRCAPSLAGRERKPGATRRSSAGRSL